MEDYIRTAFHFSCKEFLVSRTHRVIFEIPHFHLIKERYPCAESKITHQTRFLNVNPEKFLTIMGIIFDRSCRGIS